MRRIFNKKFPYKLPLLNEFLANALLVLELVSVPEEKDDREERVRDKDDRPILRAAIQAQADVLLTGGKDFLESGVKRPMIVTPSQFICAEFENGREAVVRDRKDIS